MTVIKRYDTGTAQWETIVVGREGNWDTPQTVRTETGDYTLVAGDLGVCILVDSVSDRDVDVPAGLGWQVGQRVDLIRYGTGNVTVVAGSSVVVDGTPGLRLRDQFSAATLLCVGADVFVLVGDLKA